MMPSVIFPPQETKVSAIQPEGVLLIINIKTSLVE
jgi:hypothetical protein